MSQGEHMTRTALVVDDSRSARAFLTKLLHDHGIVTDQASSAEEALEYLERERPDAVFLDHMMPGMDGLQALDAIKANPETAKIPVMMYTSEAGGLYLSQARALGAIGVLPKSMNRADIVDVLRTLHLIEDPQPRKTGDREAQPPLTRQELTQLIRELLYEHALDIREDIRLQLRDNRSVETPPPTPPVDVAHASGAPAGRGTRLAVATNVLTLALAVGFGYLHFTSDTTPRFEAARAGAYATAASATSETEPSTGAASYEPDSVYDKLIDSALRDHLTTYYPFGSAPFDDERTRRFAALFEDIKQAGFDGTIFIDIHAGRYCMNYDSSGNLELASPEQPAATCEVIGSFEPGVTNERAEQTLAFSGMIEAATRGGQIDIETVWHRTSQPLIEYPLFDYSVTAGDWNSVAASNQRISLRLMEEERETLTRRAGEPNAFDTPCIGGEAVDGSGGAVACRADGSPSNLSQQRELGAMSYMAR